VQRGGCTGARPEGTRRRPGAGTSLALEGGEEEAPAMLDTRDDYDLPRAPHPGIAAVLSVLIPGLGQVYTGRLLAGALWFLGTGFAYWAVLLPGFLVHALCIWSAYRSARWWERY
jgi:hypothetical protein